MSVSKADVDRTRGLPAADGPPSRLTRCGFFASRRRSLSSPWRWRATEGVDSPDVLRPLPPPAERADPRPDSLGELPVPRFQPYPSGWYRFRYSHELRPGQVVTGRFFGRDLVGFRTEGGAAHVVEAFCPHLGAHLGGGRVLGERLECPFHGWQYGGDGRCAHVPFAEGIPAGARVGSLPTVERNGTVHFWFDAADTAPWFDVPVVPETESPDWKRGPVHRRKIRGNVWEPRENAIDVAHGPILHRRTFPPFPGTKPEVVGWREDGEKLEFELVNTYARGKKPFRTSLYFTLTGPGHLVMRTELPRDILFLVPNTPVDEEHIVFTMLTYVRRSRVPFVDTLAVHLALRHLLSGLFEDYAIFARKRYADQPLLSDADGPIREMRRWLGQFASDGAETPRR